MTKTKMTVMVSLAIAVAATFVFTSLPVEGDTELTRPVSDEEFRQAHMQILDLRTELNKIESMGVVGAGGSDKKRELDSKIDRLMPIIDKHQEQEFAKHYIEPARKAKMELAESNLRNDIGKLGFNSYAVNLSTLTKTIDIITDDPTKNEQVRALIDIHVSEDIPVSLTNANITVIDYACND